MGSETSLMARLILIPERWRCGNGHLEVDGMCVLKDRLELARRREDMLVTRGMDLTCPHLFRDPSVSRPKKDLSF